MAIVTGDIVNNFMKDNVLFVQVKFNTQDDSVKNTDEELQKEYSKYNFPLHLTNVTLNNHPTVPNTAVVVPPGSSIDFLIGYYCRLGFEYKIQVTSANQEDIVKDLCREETVAKDSPEWLYSEVRRWEDGPSTIQINDWQDYKALGIPEEAAKNSYIITVTAYPMISYKNSNGEVISIPNNHQSLISIPVSPGLPTHGQTSSQQFGTIYDVELNQEVSTSISFLILVADNGQLQTQYLLANLDDNSGLFN